MVRNDNDIYKNMIEEGISQKERIEKVVSNIFNEKGHIDNIFLVGCGGSLAVMFPCKYVLETNSNTPVYIYNASEFNALKPINLTSKSLVILSSYSGSTPETVEAAKYIKTIGAPTIGFTGKEDSPLGDAVDYVFANYAETGVTDSKIIMLYQIIFNVLKYNDDYSKYDEVMEAMSTLADSLVKVKEKAEPIAEKFAEENKDEKFFMTLGSGILWGETYAYAICILEEMQWIHAQPVHAGEFFHGSFEIVREDTNLLIFKGEDKTRSLVDRVESFANKYTKKYTLIDTKDYELPGVPEELREYFSPLILSAVLDRFSKHLADKREHSLKIRKYMGIVEY